MYHSYQKGPLGQDDSCNAFQHDEDFHTFTQMIGDGISGVIVSAPLMRSDEVT